MMRDNDIIRFAKECLDTALRADYPQGFSVGPWWQELQNTNLKTIRDFKTALEAIHNAQNATRNAFDGRLEDKDLALQIIHFDLRELERIYPEFSLDSYPELEESPFSAPGSLFDVSGRKFSNIFFTHLCFFLRSLHSYGPDKELNTVLEIGCGYGGLARIYKTLRKNVTYVLTDLPASLFYSQNFLMLNFPGAKVKYVTSDESFELRDYDFVFVPVQFCSALKGKTIDIAINTASMQEMPQNGVDFWMDFIQNILDVHSFYSWNYFLNNKSMLSESSWEEGNLICPTLDRYWRLKYFWINPEVNAAECAPRNWLECFVERTAQKNRNGSERYAAELFDRAKYMKRGTQYWFGYLWMAIWCDPKTEYITMMLEGIDDFIHGKTYGIVDCHLLNIDASQTGVWAMNYRALRSFVKNVLPASLLRPRSKMRAKDYGEIRYYRNLLKLK